jgi:nucleotidyltransferase substrate binding protein (TIGR01987 family)
LFTKKKTVLELFVGAMALDLTPLTNATARLREGLARYERDTADEQIRDGLIQRFEFTYELCHRTLRRFLREAAASPDELDQMGFADLIRAGGEAGLLRGDWPEWRRYRDMRARTSHTYDAAVARAVVAGIPEFVSEAQHLVDALSLRVG